MVKATDTPTRVMLLAIDGSASPKKDSYGFIRFQDGPVLENGVNGTSMEEVTKVLIARLEGYQRGPFPCEENAKALGMFQSALAWLDERTARRRDQGVEGKNVAHRS